MSSTDSASPPSQAPLFRNCWSCRILCGSGIIGAAGYVYIAARKTMKLGGPTGMGTVAQISFALALASWGITIIADPVGKAKRIDK